MTAQILANQLTQDNGVAAEIAAMDPVMTSKDSTTTATDDQMHTAEANDTAQVDDSEASDNSGADDSDIKENDAPQPPAAVPGFISNSLEVLGLPDFDPVVEAQTYDAVRWIPIIGDTYSLGRAAYFALEGNMQEAGICAVSAIPFVGNTLATAKRVKDAKDANAASADTLSADGTAAPKQAPLPPVYNKLLSWFDSVMGNEPQETAQNQTLNQNENENQNQNENQLENSTGLASEESGPEVNTKPPCERRSSTNNFGDEDPVLALNLHPQEASADMASSVAIETLALDEKDGMRKSSITTTTDSGAVLRKHSSSNAVYISGAGLVPVMPH